MNQPQTSVIHMKADPQGFEVLFCIDWNDEREWITKKELDTRLKKHPEIRIDRYGVVITAVKTSVPEWNSESSTISVVTVAHSGLVMIANYWDVVGLVGASDIGFRIDRAANGQGVCIAAVTDTDLTHKASFKALGRYFGATSKRLETTVVSVNQIQEDKIFKLPPIQILMRSG